MDPTRRDFLANAVTAAGVVATPNPNTTTDANRSFGSMVIRTRLTERFGIERDSAAISLSNLDASSPGSNRILVGQHSGTGSERLGLRHSAGPAGWSHLLVTAMGAAATQ